nr:PREDICTED: odorant receptor 4-like [Megachile rotundata]
MHLATQFRILRYRMEILCETTTETEKSSEKLIPCNQVTESYNKFKNCVQQHLALINYCEALEKVFTSITLVQVMVFSVLICLFGYQILLAQSSIGRRSIYISLLVGSMGILFMYTYSCNGLMVESDKIGEAIYSTMWTQMPMNEHGRKLRKDLIMVMLRSRRICCMTAYGFFPVSVETYSTILSTAASYFTLLRSRIE